MKSTLIKYNEKTENFEGGNFRYIPRSEIKKKLGLFPYEDGRISFDFVKNGDLYLTEKLRPTGNSFEIFVPAYSYKIFKKGIGKIIPDWLIGEDKDWTIDKIIMDKKLIETFLEDKKSEFLDLDKKSDLIACTDPEYFASRNNGWGLSLLPPTLENYCRYKILVSGMKKV